jgi:translation elongation factor EF-G
MAEELGRIEKPPAEEFKKGRKLYFVPLIYRGEEPPTDYIEKLDKYWEQVEKQIRELESKLGKVTRIYHELIPAGGEDGSKAIKELSDKSYEIIQTCRKKGAQLEAIEEVNLLTEFMDWGRCLMVGLQNQQVLTRVYESYTEVGKKRNEYIASKIDETLKADEIGILLMRENHQVQFPSDIQVFYVAPPALDELKRWLRERQAKPEEES